MSELKTVYEGIEITYFEADDVWKFELRGRDRSAESLAQAKEYIDKPAPESKKAFTRIPAIHFRYYDAVPDAGEITSIAEGRRYSSGQDVWFVGADKNRSKHSASDMYQVNEGNKAKLVEIAANMKEVERLKNSSREIYGQLEKIDLSGCE